MRQAPDEIDMLLVVLDMAGDVNSVGVKNGARVIGGLVYCAIQDGLGKTFSFIDLMRFRLVSCGHISFTERDILSHLSRRVYLIDLAGFNVFIISFLYVILQ